MPHLYLHIGYPKTGTSSIQVFLRDNWQVLGRFGYCVPQVGQGRPGGHHALVRTLVGLPVPPHQMVEEVDIMRELAEAAADKSILISSEMLTGILSDPKHASTLLGKLGKLGCPIIYVVYVRNQPQWINSAYSQAVKSFRRMGDFRQFVDEMLSHIEGYCYNKWIEIASRHGADLRVRPFSKQVRNAGVVEDYCRVVGIDVSPALTSFPRVNESVGPFGVEAARRLMEWTPGGAEGLTFMQSTRSKLTLDREMQTMGIRDGSYCGLDTATAAKIEAAFTDSNDRFAEAIWASNWATVFEHDLGQHFDSNDYRDAGAPHDMQEPLRQIVMTMQGEMRHILNNPRLSVREEWNARRA